MLIIAPVPASAVVTCIHRFGTLRRYRNKNEIKSKIDISIRPDINEIKNVCDVYDINALNTV
jgi:hypothetical protein